MVSNPQIRQCRWTLREKDEIGHGRYGYIQNCRGFWHLKTIPSMFGWSIYATCFWESRLAISMIQDQWRATKIDTALEGSRELWG